MPFFSYVSAILPGKTQNLLNYFEEKGQQKLKDPKLKQTSCEFGFLCGLRSWRGWIENIHGKDYLIHCLQGDDLYSILHRLQFLMCMDVPYALSLHKMYFDNLGKDYLSPIHLPKVELLASFGECLESSDVKTLFFPIASEHKDVILEEIKAKEASIPSRLKHLEIFLQSSKKESYLIFQGESNVELPWEDLIFAFSPTAYQKYFSLNYVPIPVAIEEPKPLAISS